MSKDKKGGKKLHREILQSYELEALADRAYCNKMFSRVFSNSFLRIMLRYGVVYTLINLDPLPLRKSNDMIKKFFAFYLLIICSKTNFFAPAV